MDPISISFSAASAAFTAGKIFIQLHTFIQGARELDELLASFRNEIHLVKHSLVGVEEASKDFSHQNTLNSSAQHEKRWATLSETVSSCRSTLDKLLSLLDGISIGNKTNPAKLLVKQVKMMMNSDTLATMRSQINCSQQTMQITLQLLQLSLLVQHQNESPHSTSHSGQLNYMAEALKLLIQKSEAFQQDQLRANASTNVELQRMANILAESKHAAEDLYSQVSSYSDIGDHDATDSKYQRARVADWIPAPPTEPASMTLDNLSETTEITQTTGNFTSLKISSDESRTSADTVPAAESEEVDLDVDMDIRLELVGNMLTSSETQLSSKLYEKSEAMLREAFSEMRLLSDIIIHKRPDQTVDNAYSQRSDHLTRLQKLQARAMQHLMNACYEAYKNEQYGSFESSEKIIWDHLDLTHSGQFDHDELLSLVSNLVTEFSNAAIHRQHNSRECTWYAQKALSFIQRFSLPVDNVSLERLKISLLWGLYLNEEEGAVQEYLRTIERSVFITRQMDDPKTDAALALCSYFMFRDELEKAESICKATIAGAKQGLGTSSEAFKKAVTTMCTILWAKGLQTTRDAYLGFLPGGQEYIDNRCREFLIKQGIALDHHTSIDQFVAASALDAAIKTNDPNAIFYLMKRHRQQCLRTHIDPNIERDGTALNEYLILKNVADDNKESPFHSSEWTTALHYATFKKALLSVAALLENGFSVDSRDENHRTAIELALSNSDFKMTRLLLQHNAFVTITHIHECIRFFGVSIIDLLPSSERNTFLIMLLRRVPASQVPQYCSWWEHLENENYSSSSKAPDHLILEAASLGFHELIQAFHDGGANIDARSPTDTTPLWEAALRGHVQTVKELMGLGASVHALWKSYGLIYTVALLEVGKPLKSVFPQVRKLPSPIFGYSSRRTRLRAVPDRFPGSCLNLDSPIEKRLMPVLRELIDWERRIERPFSSALHSCISRGQLEAAKLLIQEGVRLNRKNESLGATPLHIACRNNNLDALILLINAGADVNVTANQGSTPFEWACLNSTVDFNILSQLLASGASVNTIFVNGDTALHEAIKTQNSQMVDFLLKYGASLHSANREGKNALELAQHLRLSTKTSRDKKWLPKTVYSPDKKENDKSRYYANLSSTLSSYARTAAMYSSKNTS